MPAYARIKNGKITYNQLGEKIETCHLKGADPIALLSVEIDELDIALKELIDWILPYSTHLSLIFGLNLEGYNKEFSGCVPAEQHFPTIKISWDSMFEPIASGFDDKETYALEFCKFNQICDAKIVLDQKAKLYKELSDEEPVLEIEKCFTFYDILKGLFHDLLFFGSSEERDRSLKELNDMLDEIDKGDKNAK